MKEDKTFKKAQARVEYEPVRVSVVKVTPQGVLCQSGGTDVEATLQSYTQF